MKRMIRASINYMQPTFIQEGLVWYVDGHEFKVVNMKRSRGFCVVLESWIAEDSGRDMKDLRNWKIKDNHGAEYICLQSDPDYVLYASNAVNYPWDEEYEEEEEYDDEDEYTSSTYGDYSPSNPWDAPGMSMSDFI